MIAVAISLLLTLQDPSHDVVWCHQNAIDARSGCIVWEAPTDSQDVAAHGDAVYILNSYGILERRSLKDGSICWSIVSSGVARAGRPYDWGEYLWFAGGICLVEADKLYAHDLATGRLLWSMTPNPDESVMRWCAIGDGALLDSRDNPTTAYVDMRSGTRLWTIPLCTDQRESIPLEGGDVIVTSQKGVLRLARADGGTLWRYDVREAEDTWRTWRLFVAGAFVITGTESHFEKAPFVTCLDREGGRERWKLEGASPIGAAVSTDGTRLIVAVEWRRPFRRNGEDVYGELIALDTTSWKEAWRISAGNSDVILDVDGGRLHVAEYVGCATGASLYAVNISDGRTLWHADVATPPIEHSKYSNSVRLERRGDRISLIGHESSLDHVQTFRTTTGAAISKWSSLDETEARERAKLVLKYGCYTSCGLAAVFGLWLLGRASRTHRPT